MTNNQTEMHSGGVNTAVVLLFFIRPDTLSQVFAAVRAAKPRRLYLYQDGARPNRPQDKHLIEACRKICEPIDWDCEVFRNYQEHNVGCDAAQWDALTWVMKDEEQLIFLEDDVVPSGSFFKLCDDLLERFREDKRIFMICGRNQLGETHYDANSYFFTKSDSIWGWAIWRDRWQLCDARHEFLTKPELVSKVRKSLPTHYSGNDFINICRKHRSLGLEHNRVASFESPIGAAIHLHDMLSIVPSRNLIKNVGITGDSEHTPKGLQNMPSGLRPIYLMDAMELDFPLVHPDQVEENTKFPKARLRRLGRDYWWRRQWRRISGFILKGLNGIK